MRFSNFNLLLLVLLTAACKPAAIPHEHKGEAITATQNTAVTWAIRMADSDIKRNPEGWQIDFNKTPRWGYTHGLMMTALGRLYDQTGGQKYFTYMKRYADTMVNEDGSIQTYRKTDYNIDMVNPGKFLMELYRMTGEQKYKAAILELRDQMHNHPRTSEGGFWHKKVYAHQMWLDGLYMGTPFLAQFAVEFNEPALLNDVANQVYLIDKYTWSEGNGLYYHGWDESKEQQWADPETGRSPHVWGRAMGWFAMALVDMLDYFPENHPKRPDILRVTQKMAGAIARYQDKETGLWWQVVDQGGREGNYLESSASTMYTYFLLKALRKGYIDRQYMQHAKKGYAGILKRFIREDADGTISITDGCAVAGLGGNPYRDGSYAYYVSEPKRDNDPKAVGPFILASLEIEKLKDSSISSN